MSTTFWERRRMGIRPSITAVFGIDDLQYDLESQLIIDPRLINPEVLHGEGRWEHIINMPPETTQSSWKKGILSPDWDAFPFDSIFYSYEGNERKVKELSEIVEWHTEYGDPRIIGLNLGGIYDKIPIWTLMACDEKFQQQGHMDAINYELTDSSKLGPFIAALQIYKEEHGKLDIGKVKNVLRKHNDLRCLNKLRRNGWLYPYWDFIDVLCWAKATMWLFKEIGLQVAEKDLKLMLVWRWG